MTRPSGARAYAIVLGPCASVLSPAPDSTACLAPRNQASISTARGFKRSAALAEFFA
jgi:hypothetical protein